MHTLSKGSKTLRRTLGALSLGFSMAAGIVPAMADEPATTFSKMLVNIESQANAYAQTKNAMPRVYIVDIDQINTFTRKNPEAFGNKLYYYLKSRGLELQTKDASSVRLSMGSMYGPTQYKPEAVAASTKENTRKTDDVCIVTTDTPDLSSRSLLEKWVGEAGPRELHAAIDPGPYKMLQRALWHEVWHCLDRTFVHAVNRANRSNAFEYARAIHRSEAFADVAATLTMFVRGDREILQQTADARAISSRWNGPKMMMVNYSPEHDADYYTGSTYYTTPMHDALLAHIRKTGIERIKRYTMNDIERVATDITTAHELNEMQFRAIADYLKTGKGTSPFIAAYQNRSDVARARIMTETRQRVLPYTDTLPPKIEVVLAKASRAEKQIVSTALQTAIAAALSKGQTARQGVFNQLEAWRKDLHGDKARRPDLERKLYLSALMLGNGDFDLLLRGRPPVKLPKANP
ncbi:hypothetical protein [Micavibrio aeruginosavorus]|uniref:hypothetical protein n=1 Tax=Micavibrio aeruginosavorus TaxID=349221 RepID=UPI003F4A8AF8